LQRREQRADDLARERGVGGRGGVRARDGCVGKLRRRIGGRLPAWTDRGDIDRAAAGRRDGDDLRVAADREAGGVGDAEPGGDRPAQTASRYG
jgi:hypothetical protein